MKPQEGLTPKQQLFVNYYLETLNATEAYLRAMGSNIPRIRARDYGYKLLQHPLIKQLVKKHRDRMEKKSNITKDKLLERLNKLAEEAEADGDRKAVIAAFKLMGDFLGYNSPTETVNTHVIMQEQPLFGPVIDITSIQEESKAIDEQVYLGARIAIFPELFHDGNLKELRYDG